MRGRVRLVIGEPAAQMAARAMRTCTAITGLLVAWLVLAAFDGAVAVETGDDALPAAGRRELMAASPPTVEASRSPARPTAHRSPKHPASPYRHGSPAPRHAAPPPQGEYVAVQPLRQPHVVELIPVPPPPPPSPPLSLAQVAAGFNPGLGPAAEQAALITGLKGFGEGLGIGAVAASATGGSSGVDDGYDGSTGSDDDSGADDGYGGSAGSDDDSGYDDGASGGSDGSGYDDGSSYPPAAPPASPPVNGEALAQLGELALGGYSAPKLPGGYAPNPASEAVAQGVLKGIGLGLGIGAAAANPITDYGDGPQSAPPAAYSADASGLGSGGGSGGYGKTALGGYAGPPAAEQEALSLITEGIEEGVGVGYGFQTATEILTPPPPPPPLPPGVLQAVPLAVGAGPGLGGPQQAPGSAGSKRANPGGPEVPVATPAAQGGLPLG